MVLENNYPLIKQMQRQCMVIVSKIYEAAECSKFKSNYAPSKKCACGLLLAGKRPNRTPGWPKKRGLSPTPNVCKKPTVAKPVLDVQYDGIHHWPEFRETRNQWRVCSYLSFIYCSKCHMCLCLRKRRNCFYDSHK